MRTKVIYKGLNEREIDEGEDPFFGPGDVLHCCSVLNDECTINHRDEYDFSKSGNGTFYNSIEKLDMEGIIENIPKETTYLRIINWPNSEKNVEDFCSYIARKKLTGLYFSQSDMDTPEKIQTLCENLPKSIKSLTFGGTEKTLFKPCYEADIIETFAKYLPKNVTNLAFNYDANSKDCFESVELLKTLHNVQNPEKPLSITERRHSLRLANRPAPYFVR